MMFPSIVEGLMTVREGGAAWFSASMAGSAGLSVSPSAFRDVKLFWGWTRKRSDRQPTARSGPYSHFQAPTVTKRRWTVDGGQNVACACFVVLELMDSSHWFFSAMFSMCSVWNIEKSDQVFGGRGLTKHHSLVERYQRCRK